MSEKTLTCTIDGCGKKFASKKAKESHRLHKHGIAPKWSKRQERYSPPMRDLDPDFIYSFVDDMDLPDGAHWAMIEELSGLEPGDFA